MAYPSSYPQSWTLTRNSAELERTGHTVYYRGDGAHHDSAICSKCRATGSNRAAVEGKVK